MQQIQHIPLDAIDIYGGTQTRVQTSEEAIDSYAEEMAAGAEFPPITVFYDGSTYWLADGFHRYLATKRNQQIAIAADVQPGGRIDALKHALGANATNGVYRNNHDKRNAVEIALGEWTDRSNSYIADICKVSVELVRSRRNGLEQSGRIAKPQRVTGRDGKQYPSQIEREAEGGEPDSVKAIQRTGGGGGAGEGGGGGGGGGGRKGKGDGGAFGGSSMELERDARKMIHTGEINPFELPTLMSANAHDYAITVINLLGTMKPSDPLRREGLLRIRDWIDKALVGVVERAEPMEPV